MVKDKDIVVINCTGKTVTSDRGVRYYPLERKPTGMIEMPELQDGLIAQLLRLDFSDTRRILIAHADENVRQMFKRFVQLHGVTDIIEFDHYTRTVQMAMTDSPDLIILDFISQEINAYMVLDTVFAKNNLPAIPIVAITTNEITETEKAILSDYFDQMTKSNDVLNSTSEVNLRSLLD